MTNDTGVGQLAHDTPQGAMVDETAYVPPSWVVDGDYSPPTPSKIPQERVCGAVYAENRRWRDPECKRLFLALFGSYRGFYAHTVAEQVPFDFGAAPAMARTGPSEAREDAQAPGRDGV